MLHPLLLPLVARCALDPWYCMCLGFRITKSKGMRTGNWRLLGYRRCHRVAYVELLLRGANVWGASDNTCAESGPLLQLMSYPDGGMVLPKYYHFPLNGWKRQSSSAWMVLPVSSSCCRTAFRWTSVFIPYTIFHMLNWKCSTESYF